VLKDHLKRDIKIHYFSPRNEGKVKRDPNKYVKKDQTIKEKDSKTWAKEIDPETNEDYDSTNPINPKSGEVLQ